MTLPDRAPPRKPRRLGLFGPLVLLLVAIVAWSTGWLWLRAEAARRMDAARASAGASGWAVDWKRRAISGFPFRLDIDLQGARIGERSGVALSAPRLKAEAFVFAPNHWVLVAPDGVVLARPRSGPLTVTAKVLRASISEICRRPPRISVEGVDLRFSAPAGGKPFLITAADGLHAHTRAGPGGEGLVWFELDAARARLPGLLGRIAQGGPLNLIAAGAYSRAGALTGPSWRGAVRAWSAAGGDLDVRRLQLQAGQALIDARSGRLSVGEDGRLRGSLWASLRQAPRALTAMGEAGAMPQEAARAALAVVAAEASGPVATVALDFQAGRTTLGPAAIGPSPRIY